MIKVPERGPWKDVRPGVQERDVRRYRLRCCWFGRYILQLQIERRVWDGDLGCYRGSFAWRDARKGDLPAVFSIITEVSACGGGE